MAVKEIIAHLFSVLILNTVLLTSVDAQEETATAEMPNNTSQNTTITDAGGSDKSEDSNTLAVVLITLLVILVIVGVVLFIFLRRRWRSQNIEKEKKMHMQMSSAHNAGVYQDLTVTVPVDEKPPASPEHEKLNAAQDA
ncbi:hypothetical protein PoB_007405000 [Plakobranchus ocellatus]|uniref:Uncharacterized protein n=1 Tax=Plakobranchus ocellatus TaxID=259542 RepID=A0AAV4DTR2_9GAST|nr:hypothetical protein PoB_007405000 [Plakobranchus ocellatus]